MRHRATLVAGVGGTALYLNDHRIAGPKPWAGGVVRDEWKLHVGALNKAIGREYISGGWAVRISPSKARPECVGWLNGTGGYAGERRERMVWASHWEAEGAAAEWKDCAPRLVKVRFWRRTPHASPQTGSKDVPKERP